MASILIEVPVPEPKPESPAIFLIDYVPEPELYSGKYILRKYILMLLTLVATVTYGVGFNPLGGRK